MRAQTYIYLERNTTHTYSRAQDDNIQKTENQMLLDLILILIGIFSVDFKTQRLEFWGGFCRKGIISFFKFGLEDGDDCINSEIRRSIYVECEKNQLRFKKIGSRINKLIELNGLRMVSLSSPPPIPIWPHRFVDQNKKRMVTPSSL
uniref:Uncharacterized protein n=1 Tax=Brugia malayi TaxID=6279 RepID=A8NWW9_BRUMA